jgi:NitT/TauT family transport system substrate-binding protein
MSRVAAAAAIAAMTLLSACSSSSSTTVSYAPTGSLRLGFTLNLAEAPALIGLQMGYFQADLGRVTLKPVTFTSNAAEIEALERGQLDAAYMDPVAAVAVWQSAPGGLVKIISGSASGGAELVVRGGISTSQQLARTKVTAPAGGAQQAALDWWLHQQGAAPPAAAPVTMSIGYLMNAFKSGQLAGAWEPAPADALMAAEGGRVLVNEASLWPGGQFSTAVLVTTTRYLSAHPAAVEDLLKGQVRADTFLVVNKSDAETEVNSEFASLEGGKLPAAILAQSFAQITYTDNPLAASVLAEAQHAAAAGLLKPVGSLNGLYDLGALNTVLRTAGQRPVSSA